MVLDAVLADLPGAKKGGYPFDPGCIGIPQCAQGIAGLACSETEQYEAEGFKCAPGMKAFAPGFRQG